MIKTLFFFSLSLILLLTTGCGPESSATNPPASMTEPPTLTQRAATATLEVTTETAPGEEATAIPLATSRGPNLEATDPTTVSLASGGLQFVEFFRFT